MRLWNGWGNEDSELKMELNSGLKMLLGALVGPGVSLPQASLQEVIAKVPKSRLDTHPLISLDPETRVRHARGQSLPDWLAMRSGEVDSFRMVWRCRSPASRCANYCSMQRITISR